MPAKKEPPVSNSTGLFHTNGIISDVDDVQDLACLVGPPSVDEAMALSMSPDALVLRLSRLLLLDGRPLAVEHATVPQALLRDMRNIGESLADVLTAHGMRPTRRLIRLRSAIPTRVEARHLDLAPGIEVLWGHEVATLADGRCCMTVRTVYRMDRVDLLCVTQPSGRAD